MCQNVLKQQLETTTQSTNYSWAIWSSKCQMFKSNKNSSKRFKDQFHIIGLICLTFSCYKQTWTLAASIHFSVNFFLLVGVYNAVWSRVRNAQQSVALLHLAVVEEWSFGLVHRARHQLPCAGTARASPTWIWQLHPSLLGCIKDVLVVGDLDLLLLAFWGNQFHIVCGHCRDFEGGGWWLQAIWLISFL